MIGQTVLQYGLMDQANSYKTNELNLLGCKYFQVGWNRTTGEWVYVTCVKSNAEIHPLFSSHFVVFKVATAFGVIVEDEFSRSHLGLKFTDCYRDALWQTGAGAAVGLVTFPDRQDRNYA